LHESEPRIRCASPKQINLASAATAGTKWKKAGIATLVQRPMIAEAVMTWLCDDGC
jgi:hypothetical protein